MGIYVKGMDMPAHCMGCPFMVSRENDDCILQSTEANAHFENWEQMKVNCPLVPVPQHGRLIDADEFIIRMTELWYTAFIRHIELAPTIIEAEGET